MRLRSLFSIGIHDIPLLEKLQPGRNNNQHSQDTEVEASEGWVACTTDEIIATKPQLWDILVEIPQTYEAAPQKRQWPTIRTSDGVAIQASQRDLSRYKLLHHELWKYRRASLDVDEGAGEEDHEALLAHKQLAEDDDAFNEAYDNTIVESMSWSRLAYLGFMWWASAGEMDAYTTAEHDSDRELLGELSDFQPDVQTAIIAYFHRSTSSLITNLAALIEASDDEDTGSDEGHATLVIGKDDISRIGLDTWSEADKAFIQEFVCMYFGRRAEVHGARLECCGVRIPVF